MKIINASNHRNALIQLLETEKLPSGDLPDDLSDFIAIIVNDELIGAAGIEKYGNYALLRSVVVAAHYRSRGIAGVLINNIESLARRNHLQELFLLTETAQNYFSKKGFRIIDRADVPEAVKQSSEFSHVCPVSAIVMKKSLF